ncbi:hypothetical protein N2152v2_007908 [Parachlorella kessleri]
MGRPFNGGSSPTDDPAQLRPANEEGSTEDESEEGGEGQEWILTGVEEWEDPSGGTLTEIHRAAEEGDTAALPALLDALSVSVDTLGPDSDTALHLAALYGHADCVRLLLDHGATASVRDEDGGVALHDAAAGGYTNICLMLLDADAACVNMRDDEGDTPLHNAARGGHEEVARLLVARGADATLKNEEALALLMGFTVPLQEFKTPAALADRGTPMRQFLQDLERQAAEPAPS